MAGSRSAKKEHDRTVMNSNRKKGDSSIEEADGIPAKNLYAHPKPEEGAESPLSLTKKDLTSSFHVKENVKRDQIMSNSDVLSNARVASKKKNKRRKD